MDDAVARHMRRLRILVLAFLAGFAVAAGVMIAVPDPQSPALPQAGTLFWGLAFLAAVNLATVMPSHAAMLAGARRVFAVGRQPERLFAAHFAAHLVALGRVAAVAALGLVLFLLAGHRDWFWVFWAVAASATALLWPSRGNVIALLDTPGDRPKAPTH